MNLGQKDGGRKMKMTRTEHFSAPIFLPNFLLRNHSSSFGRRIYRRPKSLAYVLMPRRLVFDCGDPW